MLQFVSPWWLLLLTVLPIQAFWYVRGRRTSVGALMYPRVAMFRSIKPTLFSRLRHTAFVLLLAGEALLIVALARPQSGQIFEHVTSEGVDIMLVLDVSGSMRAYDMGDHERIEAARDIVERFILGRQTDRLGLVVFAGESYLQCPLTVDYNILRMLLRGVSINMGGTIPDGTAIGMAIATGANRLRHSDAESKVMILLTDGSNNAGIIDPLTAARAAKQVGVKVYAVGVGVQGRAPIRVHDPFFGDRVEFIDDSLNEEILQQIADITGGEFHRATSLASLEAIYERINQMERTEVESVQVPRYTDLAFSRYIILLGIVLILAQFVLSHTLFRVAP
jgi:Ca-activated chloride channel homolog